MLQIFEHSGLAGQILYLKKGPLPGPIIKNIKLKAFSDFSCLFNRFLHNFIGTRRFVIHAFNK